MGGNSSYSLSAVIVEDQKEAQELLEEILKEQKLVSVKKLKIFQGITAAEYYLRDNPVDLLFLDIELQQEEGFQILESLSEYSFRTVIVSGHTDKAIKAFEYGVLDFIPKSAHPRRVEKSLRLFVQNQFRFMDEPSIAVQDEDIQKNISLADIIYLEADGDKVSAKHSNLKRYFIKKSISAVEQKLPEDFFRIHKSYIVNLNRVEKINVSGGGKYSVLMNNGEEIPVSRNLYIDLKNKFSLF